MKTIDYDELLEKRLLRPGEMNQLREAARLADVARNLQSVANLAEAQAAELAAKPTAK